MKNLIMALALVTLTGCDQPQHQKFIYNPDIRQKMFKECMQLAAATSQAGHYNDNAEVVESCSAESYRMALIPAGWQPHPEKQGGE